MALGGVAGLLLALGQPPFGIPWLAIIALPVLFYLLLLTASWKAAFALGWAAGLGYFGLTMSWIIEPFLVDVERYGWMAPFALALMAGGLALFWGLGFALATRWKTPLFWAACWTAAELLRSVIFTGFPWALMAYNWVDTPIIQAVSVIGVHGLGFLIVLAGGLLVKPRTAIFAVIIAGTMFGFGAWRLSTPVELTGQTVRLIQPNATQVKKWDPAFIPQFYQRQLEMSAAAGSPDIVIWPEVAIAYYPAEQQLLRSQITDAAQAPVILGALRRDPHAVYNSLFLLESNGNIGGIYDKTHLVPFGEYMPLRGLARSVGLRGMADVLGEGISFGAGLITLASEEVPPFLPLICYEAIFPQSLPLPRPEWLVQITNDAWFGGFNGPFQHLAQARVRAIEHGLPLARAANTGVSAMVDPYGRINASLALGQEGYVDAALPKPLAETIYSSIGQWPITGVILLVFVGGLLRRKRV